MDKDCNAVEGGGLVHRGALNFRRGIKTRTNVVSVFFPYWGLKQAYVEGVIFNQGVNPPFPVPYYPLQLVFAALPHIWGVYNQIPSITQSSALRNRLQTLTHPGVV